MSEEPASNPISPRSHTARPSFANFLRLAVGVLGVGTSGPLLASGSMPVAMVALWRNLIGALVTLPFAWRSFARVRTTLAPALLYRALRSSAFSGVLLGLHFLGYFSAMRLTSVAAGTALAATQPIFAALWARITGHHIPLRSWLGMVAALLGVVITSNVDAQLSWRAFQGDLAALGSGAAAAAYVVISSKVRESLDTSLHTFTCYISCALTSFFIAIGLNQLNFFSFENPVKEWLILGGLVLGAQILGHTMLNKVVEHESPTIVSMVVLFEVPVAAILAAIFNVGNRPQGALIPGILVLLVGSAFVVTRD